MKTPIFLVALLAPVALYAAPGVVTVVGDESSGIFTKQFGATAPIPVSYTGISPGVETSFEPVAYNSIIPDSFVQVVDTSGNVVDPNEIYIPTPTLYHQGGSNRPYHNQIGGGYQQGGYYPGGGYQQGGYYPGGGYPHGHGVGGVIGSVVSGVVGGLVHGQHGHHGGGYPGGYPGRYPGGYPGGGNQGYYPGSGGYYPGGGHGRYPYG